MKRFIGQRVIKTAIGAPIAIYLAEAFGLTQIYSAGIIVILSIQNTKRDSLNISIKRGKAVLIALALSSILFTLFTNHIIIFGVFLLLFIPICVRMKISDGIVVSSVLVTHLLSSPLSVELLKNEISLFLIGALVALALNLYMPSIEPKLKEELKSIEEKMKNIIFKMSKGLKGENNLREIEGDIKSLEKMLSSGRERAVVNYNNYFFINSSYYTKYMDMRTLQLNTLKGMLYNFERLYNVVNQSIILGEFTKKISEKFHENNDCTELLEELYELRKGFKEMELPKTREEFETRAILFRYLGDMEHFIKLKRDFIFINNKEE